MKIKLEYNYKFTAFCIFTAVGAGVQYFSAQQVRDLLATAQRAAQLATDLQKERGMSCVMFVDYLKRCVCINFHLYSNSNKTTMDDPALLAQRNNSDNSFLMYPIPTRPSMMNTRYNIDKKIFNDTQQIIEYR